ncbi:hypothetical protein ACJX0J_018016, partial [Zea mays]
NTIFAPALEALTGETLALGSSSTYHLGIGLMHMHTNGMWQGLMDIELIVGLEEETAETNGCYVS